MSLIRLLFILLLYKTSLLTSTRKWTHESSSKFNEGLSSSPRLLLLWAGLVHSYKFLKIRNSRNVLRNTHKSLFLTCQYNYISQIQILLPYELLIFMTIFVLSTFLIYSKKLSIFIFPQYINLASYNYH